MSSPSNGSAPVRSMTGYASIRQPASAGELTVSLRSVNHRGLDLHFLSSSDFAPFEASMRALLKENIGRGHVEIRLALARESAAETGRFNRGLLARYAALFRQLCEELKLDSKPDLNLLLNLPGVLNDSQETKPLDKVFEAELLDALSNCLRNLNEVREREGRELVAGLSPELAGIESATNEIAAIRAAAVPYFHARSREKLTELLSGSSVSESRLAEEAAILADRSDVQEELTRLSVHTQELRRILDSGGEIGKPLDFLLQEMNRETNTTLSKNSGAGEPGLKITSLALGIKAAIERIREQALNLE